MRNALILKETHLTFMELYPDFEHNTSVITYSAEAYANRKFSMAKDCFLSKKDNTISWMNTYGLNHVEAFKAMVLNNTLDDFLLRLLTSQNPGNKVLELGDQLFIAINILKTENQELEAEQLFFVIAPNFLWCIQEKEGDQFDWIRTRIADPKSLIRKKKADYLLFFILETVISNYKEKYEASIIIGNSLKRKDTPEPTPAFMFEVEQKKAMIDEFRKASHGLRDTVAKLERVELKGFQRKYFSELREQINTLIGDIDSDLRELESQVHVFFSLQGHRLNEIMKTLTIFSVIFIPLTFIAGIYGMNFSTIPELQWKYGYFILLGLMLLITLIAILIFRKKRWF